MYKKIVLFVCCISPLLFAFTSGYPVKTFQEYSQNGLIMTRRCFKVGELSSFIDCFSLGKTVARQKLVIDLNNKLDSLFPGFNIVFFVSLIFLLFSFASLIFFI